MNPAAGGGLAGRRDLFLVLRYEGRHLGRRGHGCGGTSVHFKPLHLFPFYQERLGVRAGQFPAAERCFEETLSLPIYPDLTDADVDRVAERIRAHLSGAR